ncbi:bifunctional P-450/NADPH-P450 reductase [Phanerochaete sordida]|uniref:Bifunctional P-450/NADPH-P450 reductase n=1 Tax=Phanerochaete sordida TaxID=48140 RepID=A0A9P3GAL0_9APHY|nr:bifunctional P-450/NADPH-P450 reductase [Phanerochaete sordida]
MTHPIPSPPSVPFLGHVPLLDREVPMWSLMLLARQYGDLYRLDFPGRSVLVAASQELVHELSDDKRFKKTIQGPLGEVRAVAGDGLFTADALNEDNWEIAHRVLMPAFNLIKMRDMFDDMVDVVEQMVLKWERFGPHFRIDPAADFTALTLEAISLCTLSYRINTFYTNGVHPFAKAMSQFLQESGGRSRRGKLLTTVFARTATAQWEENKAIMMKYADDIIEDRKKHPSEKKDVLDIMLTEKDPVTGRKMTELSIKQNLLTFLIAGHETTSGMLTFTLYYLIKYPETMRKLREEVDTVIGDRAMTADDLNKLPYLIAVMRESLRLGPSVPARMIEALADTTVLGGRHKVAKGQVLVVANFIVQRDPRAFGADAEEFRPERMLDGRFDALPPGAWQPFGTGMRACIGRAFAWQEVQVALVRLVQRFSFAFADARYDLRLKQTLSLKPHECFVTARPRVDRPRCAPGAPVPPRPLDSGSKDGGGDSGDGHPMYVYFGSNMGTGESFAQRIAGAAGRHGFTARIAPLDAATAALPTDGPVVVVTASYEGAPPDNAARFAAWLDALDAARAPLKGVAYAVFGCGNRDWVQTYQRVPARVDGGLAGAGAARLVPRGEGDAASGGFFEAFVRWEDKLWGALGKRYATATSDGGDGGVQVRIVDAATSRADALRQPDAALGTVVENRVLTAPGAPVKRHIEIELPEGTTYSAGDYLAIIPTNPPRDVRRALVRFGLLPEQEITIESAGPTSLPTGRPISVHALLSGYVELAQPATTRDLRLLASSAPAESEQRVFAQLADELAAQPGARASVLDILEAHPAAAVPFAAFLQLLPALRARQYSVASSPLAHAARAALTVRVFAAPAAPAPGAPPRLGVASSYLGALRPGDRVQLAVRPCRPAFALPADPAVPLVLVCAGAGLAPMRGFLQERAVQRRSGRDVARSLLFFGCRSPDEDYLYCDEELEEWAKLGVVDVRPAFSRASERAVGCKYVQDRLWHDRAEVAAAWDAGAKLYVCGAAKMAAGVRAALVRVVADAYALEQGAAVERFGAMMAGRFATDVFE